MTNAEYIAHLSDKDLDYQIAEACKELRTLDRLSPAYFAAIEDLREMFIERKVRCRITGME